MTDIKNPGSEPEVQDEHITLHHSGIFADDKNTALHLSAILQSTLEVAKMLELFYERLSAVVPHAGLSYACAEDDYETHFGTEATHKCTYKLMLLDSNIGELTFSRSMPFNKDDMQQLQRLTATLLYPLNNALLYRKALERAHKDPLTGIGNRAAMDKAMEQEVDLASRHATPLSIIMMDIDHFKSINDTHGHITGDIVLKNVAQCMAQSMRRSDIIYRYGGEEFLILLRNTVQSGAQLLAERIRHSVEAMRLHDEGADIKVTVSAGLTSFKENEAIHAFFDRCDQALLQAKQQGRNRIKMA